MLVFVRRHLSTLVAVLGLSLGGVLVVQTTQAQPPTAGDAALGSEIAGSQRDVAGATSPDQRAAAQAKLDVLLKDQQERTAARAAPPASKEQDAAKAATLEAFGKTVEAKSAGYTPLIRETETGALMDGMPWNFMDKTFAAGTWWRGPKAADGTQLAVWAGEIRNNPNDGAVLVRRFVDDGDGSVVWERRIDVPEHGALTFVDEHGGVLQLRGKDGTNLSFDTASLTLR